MRRFAFLLLLLAPAFAGIDDFADQLQPIRAIPPTPQGDSHLGNLPSGQWVQIRLPLPNQPPLAYGISLGNVVGFSGRGTSYQLIVRRDGPEGKILHEGSVIPNGDAWNAENVRTIDLLDGLIPDDYKKGWLDLFVTGKIENDGFTLYRDNDGRPINALMAPATPEIRAAIEQAKQARERGLALIPPPQRLTLQPGDLKLAGSARIVIATDDPDDRFAATDLAAAIAECCGRKLPVAVGQAKPADIVLAHTNATLEGGPEAYRLTVGEEGVRAEARSPEGLFYAACTIGQLASPAATLPHCRIEDWPAFPLRGLQYDVARGQTVNVDWWKRVIRTLARCKLNAIMIYGEDDYAFDRYPFLGRPGTFTPAKAKELSEYAWRYHLQLIPQFEALGHAAAVLGHEELKGLREAGGAWVFCTSKPATWAFLDDVIGELAEQFPHSRYLHIGADEFEGGFGLCPECKAKVDKVGYTGLYVEHMNHLQQLCAKHDRTMLFWPSHGGPSEELSYLSIKGAAQLNHDMIPTEWIYHGPAQYPELEQYQKLGFKDVWASPAVVCYSTIVPDYTTSFRGIRGFLKAGQERPNAPGSPGPAAWPTTPGATRSGSTVLTTLPAS
ncbi:MAG: beta-N-acetylhexosaminidase [Armatimonadetes bacterium]|nr:beta-N-acetylhexosaminidase [Armatimonadota bacterium]